MSSILYYLVILPISRLPFFILYGISDFLYLVLYRMLSYRRKVVRGNLVASFPEKSLAEIKTIESQFYRHFCDILVETFKMFSISQKDLSERSKITNPEVMDALYDAGKSIILVGGHYNNWEIGAAILSTQVKHHIIGIYAPLSNPFFNEKVLKSRSRFGMEMLSKNEVKEGFERQKNNLSAFIFATDQSPTHSKFVHWTNFLNQKTAVALGAERFSKEYDYPVVYIYVNKVKRGYYEMEAKVMEPNPGQTMDGAITEMHVRWLENQVRAVPQFWLWTHKRWKRKFTETDKMYQP